MDIENYDSNELMGSQVANNLITQARAKKDEAEALLQSKGDALTKTAEGIGIVAPIVNKYTGLEEKGIEGAKLIGQKVKGLASDAVDSVQQGISNLGTRIQNMRPPSLPQIEPNYSSSYNNPAFDTEFGTDALIGQDEVNTNPLSSTTGAREDEFTTSSTAENVGADIGEDIAGDAVADEVGAGLTATGVLAPLGLAVEAGSFLYTLVDGIKDLFESHHQHEQTPDYSIIPSPALNPDV